MAAYHRYSTRPMSDDDAKKQTEEALTKRRVQQFNDEITISRDDESNFYVDKAMRRAHHRRGHR